MEFVSAAAPFLLALFLLFDGITVSQGKEWFKRQVKRNLEALQIDDPEHLADDIWEDAKAAAEPGSFCTRALVVLLGLYLLLPEDVRSHWVVGLSLFAAALVIVRLAAAVSPRGRLWRQRTSAAKGLSALFIIAGLGGALAKSLF